MKTFQEAQILADALNISLSQLVGEALKEYLIVRKDLIDQIRVYRESIAKLLE